MQSSQPFFIVGYQRSGTSLLREEISAHPNLCVPPECSFLTWLSPVYGDWTAHDTLSERRSEFVTDVVRARKFHLWAVTSIQIHHAIVDARPSTYPELVSCVYQAFGTASGKPRAQWGDKNNVHGLKLNQILSLFAEARIIWVVRDPRDIWASLTTLSRAPANPSGAGIAPTVPETVAEFCRGWVDYNERVSLALSQTSAPFRIVRYEDYVTRPVAGRQKIFDFLEVEPASGNWAKRTPQQLGEESLLPWKLSITQAPHKKSIGKFRELIPQVDADLIANLTTRAQPFFQIESKNFGLWA